MTLNSVIAVALCYFTDFGKPAFQHIIASNCGEIYVGVSTVFCNVCAMSSVRKFAFAISSPDEFLVEFEDRLGILVNCNASGEF